MQHKAKQSCPNCSFGKVKLLCQQATEPPPSDHFQLHPEEQCRHQHCGGSQFHYAWLPRSSAPTATLRCSNDHKNQHTSEQCCLESTVRPELIYLVATTIAK